MNIILLVVGYIVGSIAIALMKLKEGDGTAYRNLIMAFCMMVVLLCLLWSEV